jgi:hypothetical protein
MLHNKVNYRIRYSKYSHVIRLITRFGNIIVMTP